MSPLHMGRTGGCITPPVRKTSCLDRVQKRSDVALQRRLMIVREISSFLQVLYSFRELFTLQRDEVLQFGDTARGVVEMQSASTTRIVAFGRSHESTG